MLQLLQVVSGLRLFNLPKVHFKLCCDILTLSYYVNLNPPVLGAKVIAAAGSEDKLDIAKRYGGADYGVNYTKPGWQKEVLKLTGGKGVNVIYDPVGLINGLFPFFSMRRKLNKKIRLLEMYCLERKGFGHWVCSWDD